MRRRYRVRLSDGVQGVGLRWQMSEYARRHDVAGWVRNMPEGKVEAELEGEAERLEEMVSWLKSDSGPGIVHKCEMEEQPLKGENAFKVLH